MKYFALVLTLASSAAFASSPDCTNLKSKASADIVKAAEAAGRAANSTRQVSVQAISYIRTTKDGKLDQYSVQLNVNEECMGQAIVNTKADTCDVVSKAGGAIVDGGCG